MQYLGTQDNSEDVATKGYIEDYVSDVVGDINAVIDSINGEEI